jgi:adenine-specific DNA methylase
MNFIEDETPQKLRGGYYTPSDLADFMARWVAEISPARVLEPSCGDGEFIESVGRVPGFEASSLRCFELNPGEAAKARKRARQSGVSNSEVRAEDFLGWALQSFDNRERQFDAVLGNPPFVRYQYLPEQFQKRAEAIFNAFDLPFTKHTNAWVPFVIASLALLRPGGRLAMVVPAEIIHVTHAQSLRSYLGRECRRLVIIDPEELWFAETLQGAVILLAEKVASEGQKREGLGIYPVKGREFLRLQPHKVFSGPTAMNGKTVAGKWTRALLDQETRDLVDELSEHPEVHRFDQVAEVDVGIVTGANKFFLVPDHVVEAHALGRWAYPMFGRSEHCPGVIYDQRQHAANSADGKPVNFLWFDATAEHMHDCARAYIEMGEAQQLHTRYKCRIRSPWYRVPSVYATEIGMLKRAHDVPRLILNRVGAYTTDTAYRIRANGLNAERLVTAFLNPLTALSAELEGRHYGGGVLELVPSEIERLLIPLPSNLRSSLAKLDADVRTNSADEVLAAQGTAILGALGIGRTSRDKVLLGWSKLRNRRQRTSEEGSEPLNQSLG